jgi:2,3-bisphosphoglycerate-independent phosphoglycerate mutase
MAYLLVILDGAADCPSIELHGKTPLEIADTPNLDWIASRGRSCLVTVLPGGKVPQTHTGVLSILGYNIESVSLPRGPIEALGHFSHIPGGALCARCNFGSVVNGKITDRRVCRDITQKEADTLVDFIMKSVKLESGLRFLLGSVSTYRLSFVLCPDTRSLSDRVSNTDPGYATNAEYAVPQRNKTFDILPAKALDESDSSYFTANVINDFIWRSHEALSGHPLNKSREKTGNLPANFILARDFGIGLPNLESISGKYNLSSAYIFELPIELGLSRLLGMKPVGMPLDGDGNLDYTRLSEIMLSGIENHDLVVCHVKGPDDAGHDGDWKAKVHILKNIDKFLFSTIRKGFDFSRDIIVVTSDHATPWSIGTHTSDRTPVTAAGRGIIADRVKSFSEKACESGDMGLSRADQILPYIMGVK